jgi:hypothetical protein
VRPKRSSYLYGRGRLYTFLLKNSEVETVFFLPQLMPALWQYGFNSKTMKIVQRLHEPTPRGFPTELSSVLYQPWVVPVFWCPEEGVAEMGRLVGSPVGVFAVLEDGRWKRNCEYNFVG